jgi:hypothetical protein
MSRRCQFGLLAGKLVLFVGPASGVSSRGLVECVDGRRKGVAAGGYLVLQHVGQRPAVVPDLIGDVAQQLPPARFELGQDAVAKLSDIGAALPFPGDALAVPVPAEQARQEADNAADRCRCQAPRFR